MGEPRWRPEVKELIYRKRTIRQVGIFGLGKSNVGVIYYLKRKYPHIAITLRQDSARLPKDVLRAVRFDRILLGSASCEDVTEELVFLSPTVKRQRLATVEDARITSDAQFYLDNVTHPVLAVTGSDGKSTTTTLASLMLSGKGRHTSALGNIGVAMTPHLDDVRATLAVAELSSFQLMTFVPRTMRALITNISENHLDFHTSMDEYIDCKYRIFEGCEEPVVNCDCPLTLRGAAGREVFCAYSMEKDEDELSAIINARHYTTLRGGIIYVDSRAVLDTNEARLRTRHNINNLLAAISLTHGLCDEERVREVAREFSGLRHRCEYVGTFSGVEYYNSSIDSTPLRTATTLSSFDGRLTVILGGRSKGLDYAPLVRAIASKASAVYLCGECAADIKRALLCDSLFTSLGIPIYEYRTLEDATEGCAIRSREGERVILSPASTSFDAFSSFEERGEKFKEAIRNYYYKRT